MGIMESLANGFGMDGYKVYLDDSAGYTLFVNRAGEYYILRASVVSTVTTYEYYKPAANGVLATDWTGRAGLTYVAYNAANFA